MFGAITLILWKIGVKMLNKVWAAVLALEETVEEPEEMAAEMVEEKVVMAAAVEKADDDEV